MAGKKGDNQPIIIKKKKKGGHEAHHGGAWKVAYADFVTAMMAFFLLMWLLNATTEEQRSGIADYFSPVSVSDSSSGGGGVLSGQTVSREGALVDDRARIGMTLEMPAPPEPESGRGDGDESAGEAARRQRVAEEDARFDEAVEKLFDALRARSDLEELESHLMVDQTPEGLRIQIVDEEDSSMFDSGSAAPRPRTEELLRMVGEAIADLPNDLSVKGHTDSVPFRGENGYGNWELSADRANASRRTLVAAGLDPARVHQVVGRADQDLLLPDDPTNARNRRISIILLRQEAPPDDAPASDTRTNAAPDSREGGPSILGRDDAEGARRTMP